MKFKKGNKVNLKHGMCGTKIYRSWESMKHRCLNKNNPAYKNYGDRGITICPEWLNGFQNFYKDMGDIPNGKSIDRIDNDKGYYKENCKWSTPKQQANNRRNNRLITYKGKTQNVTQWAEELKINDLFGRLNGGWTIKQILNR